MFANYVKGLTIACTDCKTSITFEVPKGNNEIRELFNAADELICPRCKESLSHKANDMIRAISTYNNALKVLSDTEESTKSRLL